MVNKKYLTVADVINLAKEIEKHKISADKYLKEKYEQPNSIYNLLKKEMVKNGQKTKTEQK